MILVEWLGIYETVKKLIMLRFFGAITVPGPGLWQRFVSFVLVIAIAFGVLPNFSFAPQIAEAQFFGKSAEETYSLVAVLVDKKLLDDSANYEGLDELDYSSIAKSTLKKRIERYAEDVQKSMEFTKTMILAVDIEKESVYDIASSLESIYFDGDNLVGVVLVGDLPLPVVNKNGNRFISLLPYTDFDEKSYIYNPLSGDFEKNDEVVFPRSELWHGVIRAPQELKGDDSKEALASFFDKNHLYHIGHSDFAEFERSVLISDLFHERELMNTGFFRYYEKFIENAEANAYLRINKHWAEDLYKEFVGDKKNRPAMFCSRSTRVLLKKTAGFLGLYPIFSRGRRLYLNIICRILSCLPGTWLS